MKIYFTIADERAVIRDAQIRGFAEVHCWRLDPEDDAFGVCIPKQDSYGDDAAERLAELGADVLPALDDSSADAQSKMQAKVKADPKGLFKKHGIAETDRTRDIARKMHGVSGFRPLKPNKY
jgi:hypothetical protein